MVSVREDPIPSDEWALSRSRHQQSVDVRYWPADATLARRGTFLTEAGITRSASMLLLTGIYVAFTLGITYPLFSRGYPLAFDMSFGPTIRMPIEAFALGGDFGRRLPVYILLSGLAHFVSPAWIARVILVSIPLIGGIGMHRLAPTNSEIGRFFAGLLYILNPFVYERMLAGHWHILLGYALLPWALPSLLEWARVALARSLLKAALWLGVIGVVSFAVALIAFAFTLAAMLVLRERARGGRLKSAMALMAMFAITNATWIVAALARLGDVAKFSSLDFRAFLVRGDSPWSAATNLFRLTGFFREDFRSPFLDTAAGWILTTVILGLVVLGAIFAVRTKRMGERTAVFLIVAGMAVLVVALGERAPIVGPLLGWLYPRIPGMQVFRETQKLIGLNVLIYALFGAIGVEVVVASDRSEHKAKRASMRHRRPGMGRILASTAILILPAAWTPGLFALAGGKIIVAEYPAGWYEAEDVLKAHADGKTLVLPWHVHMPLSFTNERTNLNPAGDFFTNDLLQAFAVEFPGFTLPVNDPLDRYVRSAISEGVARSDFGAILAPLGVGSVLVLKEADWRELSFLEHQVDLEKVLENDSVIVYAVTPRWHGRLMRLAPPGELTSIIPPDPRNTGYLAAEEPGEGECIDLGGAVVRDSAYSYSVPTAGCWIIPETRRESWMPSHLLGVADSGVSLAARTGGPQRVVYWPALIALAGHVLSGISVLSIGLVLLRSRSRKFRGS